MKTISLKVGLAAALAATTMAATPVLAQSEGGATVAVQYRDLNLATAEGQDRLRQRMVRAAEQVCGLNDQRVGTRIPSREAQRCYNETVEGFERQFAALVEREARGG